MENVNQAFHTKILSISQRQAAIKLIEKKKTGINVTYVSLKTGDQFLC